MKRPAIYLLIASILNGVCGILAGNAVFSLLVSNGIDLNHLRWFPSLALFMLSVIYLFIQKKVLSHTLTAIHLLISFVSVSCFTSIPYILAYAYQGLAGFPRRYYDVKPFFAEYEPLTTVAKFSFSLALAAQFILFINFFFGLRKNPKP